MPVSHNNMALPTAQQNLTIAMNSGEYHAVEVALARKVDGNVRYGEKCVEDAKQMVSPYIDSNRIGSNKLLACLICHRFNPAKYPLPVNLSTMIATRDALYTAVTQGAVGFTGNRADATDILTTSGRDSGGNTVESFANRYIKPISSIFTDIAKKLPTFDEDEYSSLAAWYVIGYMLFKQRMANDTNANIRATDIGDVFDNYIDPNKGSTQNPKVNVEGMPVVQVSVDRINTHTRLAPVKLDKLIMKVSGINFVTAVSERASKMSKSRITKHVLDNERVFNALYELFTSSGGVKNLQRRNTYESDRDENVLTEADGGTSKGGQIDAIIDQISELPVTQIEEIRKDLLNRIDDVFYDHNIDDMDTRIIEDIIFFGTDNCLSKNIARGKQRNSLLLKKGVEFAKKMSVVSTDPLTVQLENHRIVVDTPDTMEHDVFPYAIHGYISLDKNQSIIKVTGLIPFSHQNENGELVQDLGESDDIKEFRGILDDAKHGKNDKYIDSLSVANLHKAGFNNTLTGNKIADKINTNIKSVVNGYVQKYVDSAKQTNPDAKINTTQIKTRYQGIVGKRVSTAAAYMKSLDTSRQELVKALSSIHSRSANTIFLKYFDKGNLIVNNATGNKSSIDAGELNQQKYEAIRLYANNELGDDVRAWDATHGDSGYMFKLTALNQQLFNANRNTSNAVGSIEVIRRVSTKLVNAVRLRGTDVSVSDAISQLIESTNPVMDERIMKMLTTALDNTESTLKNIATMGKRIDMSDDAFVAEIADIATQISDVTNSADYTGNNLEFIFSLGGLSADNENTLYVRVKHYINELGKRVVKSTLNIPDGIIDAIDNYYDQLSHIMSDVNNEGHKISDIINDAYQVVCGDGLTGGIAITIGNLSNMFNEGARIISGEIYAAVSNENGITEIPGDIMRPEDDVYGTLPDEVTFDDGMPSDEDATALDNATYEQEFEHSYSDEYHGNNEQQSEGMIALHSIATELDAEDAVDKAITLYDESIQFINKYQGSVYDTKNRMVSSVEGIMYRTINMVMSELIDYVLDKPRVTSIETGASRLIEINEKLKEISSIYSNGRMNSKYVISRFNSVVNAFNSAAAKMSGKDGTISNHDGQVNPDVATGILGILNTMDILGNSIERDEQDNENSLLNAASGNNTHMRHNKITGSMGSLSDMTIPNKNLKDPVGHDSIVDTFARAIIAPANGQLAKGKKTILSDNVVNHFQSMALGMKHFLEIDANLRNRAMSLGELFGRNDYAPVSSKRDEQLRGTSVDFTRPDNLVNGKYMGTGTRNTDRMTGEQDENYKTSAQSWSKGSIVDGTGLLPDLFTGVGGNNISLAIINDIFDDERRYEGESYPTVIETVNNLLTGGDVTTYNKNLNPTITEPGANKDETRTMYNTKGSLVVVHHGNGDGMTVDEICKNCEIPTMQITNESGVVTDETIKPFVIAIRKNIVNKMIDTACNNWGHSSDSRLNHLITINKNNPNSIYTDKEKFNSILKDRIGDKSASDTSIPLAELVVSLNPDVMSMALDKNAMVTNARASNNAGVNSNTEVTERYVNEMLSTLEPDISEDSNVTPEGLLVTLANIYAIDDKDSIATAKKRYPKATTVFGMFKQCGIAKSKLVETILSLRGTQIREHFENAHDALDELATRLNESGSENIANADSMLTNLIKDVATNNKNVSINESKYPEYKTAVDNIRATGIPLKPYLGSSGRISIPMREIFDSIKSIDEANAVTSEDEKLSEIIQPNTTKRINVDGTNGNSEAKNTLTDMSKEFMSELRNGIGDSVRELAHLGKDASFIKKYIIKIADDMGSRAFDETEYLSNLPANEQDIAGNIINTLTGISKMFDFPVADMGDAVTRVLEYKPENPAAAQIARKGKLGIRQQNIATGKNGIDSERFNEMYKYLYHKSIVDEIDNNTYQLYDTVEQKLLPHEYLNAFELYSAVKKIASIQNTVYPDRVTEFLFRHNMDTPTATPLLDEMVYHMLTTKVVNAQDNTYSVNDSKLKMSDGQFITNVVKALNSIGKKISDPVKGLTSDDIQMIDNSFVVEVKQLEKTLADKYDATHKPMPKANMRYMTDTDKDTLEKTEVVNGKEVCGVCHGTGKVDGHVCPQCKGMPDKVEFQKSAPEIVGKNDVSGPVQPKNNVITPKEPAEDTPLTESIAVDFWDRW